MVEVSMPTLPCGVLGAARSNGYVTGREPLAADQIYSMALAERLVGESLNGDEPDLLLEVNGNACPDDGPQWYLGLSAAPAGLQSLFELVVHELAHGLGFESLVNPSTGIALREQAGLDPFSRRLFDLESQRYWHELNAVERARSAVRPRGVVWGGTRARKVAARWLQPGTPRIILPEKVAGFQGWLTPPSGWVDFDTISAPLRSLYPQSPCDDDSPGSDVDALLVVGEGACSVHRLAEVSARLGAVAVLEVEAGEQAPAPTFGGREPRGAPLPEIPVFRVARRDGEVLAALQGVEVRLANDRGQLRGADEEGRPLMYTPNTPRFGASLSHWDPLLSPSAILEPVPAPDVRHLRFELERAVLEDIGWGADRESSDGGGDRRLGAASGSAVGCATSAPGMPSNIGWGCVLSLAVLLRRRRVATIRPASSDPVRFWREPCGTRR